RRLVELVEDLVADRAVGVVLERLGAVLEERQHMLAGVYLSGLLGLVDVRAAEPDVGAEPLELYELAAAGAGRGEDHGLDADLRGGPGGGDAVVAGGGGHNPAGAVVPVALQHGQGGTPLERSELVHVLSLQIQAAAVGEGG